MIQGNRRAPADVLLLTDADLIAAGIDKVVHRRKLRTAAAAAEARHDASSDSDAAP
eukprot:gene6934-6748_t